MNSKSAGWNTGVEQAALSDTGMRRTSNQDSFAVLLASGPEEWQRHGHLFLVADGMGAHAAGELASKLSADIIPLTYHKLNDDPLPLALRKAVEDANQKIHHRGQADPEFHGMGTTTSVLVLGASGAIAGHVGDSRIYRVRGNQIQQLTFDHSLVWEMWSGGDQQPKDMPQFIPRNIITRSLGPSADVEVDIEGPFPTQPGDIYLLCSDGLTGQISDEEIGQLMSCLPPAHAGQALIDLANLRGGPDNITAVIVRVTPALPASVLDPNDPQQFGLGSTITSGSSNLAPMLALLCGGLLAVAAIIAFAAGQGVLAALAALGAAGCATWFALQPKKKEMPAPEPRPVTPRRLRSPYRTASAVPTPEFLGELAKVAAQLKDAATGESWKIEWGTFEKHREAAEAAAHGKNLDKAVAEYALAISFMMSELRRQGKKRSESVLDDLLG